MAEWIYVRARLFNIENWLNNEIEEASASAAWVDENDKESGRYWTGRIGGLIAARDAIKRLRLETTGYPESVR